MTKSGRHCQKHGHERHCQKKSADMNVFLSAKNFLGIKKESSKVRTKRVLCAVPCFAMLAVTAGASGAATQNRTNMLPGIAAESSSVSRSDRRSIFTDDTQTVWSDGTYKAENEATKISVSYSPTTSQTDNLAKAIQSCVAALDKSLDSPDEKLMNTLDSVCNDAATKIKNSSADYDDAISAVVAAVKVVTNAREAAAAAEAARKKSANSNASKQNTADGNSSQNGSSSDSSSRSSSSETRTEKGDAIVSAAMSLIGQHMDCTMLVTLALQRATGIYFHGWPADYANFPGAVQTTLENAVPGDILIYDGHVAIYAGDGKMIHAANPRRGVVMDPLRTGSVVFFGRPYVG